MSYSSEFTILFLRLLKKLDPQIRERVLKAIEDIVINPRRGSQLVYSKQPAFKWRIGDYRVIYLIDEERNLITFIMVGHRGKVYNRLD